MGRTFGLLDVHLDLCFRRTDGGTDGWIFHPLFYRTLIPLGPLPKKPSKLAPSPSLLALSPSQPALNSIQLALQPFLLFEMVIVSYGAAI